MTKLSKIELPVDETTAMALTNDPRRREAIGRLVDRLVRPGPNDLLMALLAKTASEAEAAGLTEDEIDAELAAYNAERRN